MLSSLRKGMPLARERRTSRRASTPSKRFDFRERAEDLARHSRLKSCSRTARVADMLRRIRRGDAVQPSRQGVPPRRRQHHSPEWRELVSRGTYTTARFSTRQQVPRIITSAASHQNKPAKDAIAEGPTLTAPARRRPCAARKPNPGRSQAGQLSVPAGSAGGPRPRSKVVVALMGNVRRMSARLTASSLPLALGATLAMTAVVVIPSNPARASVPEPRPPPRPRRHRAAHPAARTYDAAGAAIRSWRSIAPRTRAPNRQRRPSVLLISGPPSRASSIAVAGAGDGPWPDNKTYIVRASDRLLDGEVRAVTAEAVVFVQNVNDPLSPVRQREIRKPLRIVEEGK